MAPCVLELCAKYFKSERSLTGSLVIINLIPIATIVQQRTLFRFNEDENHVLAVMVKDAKKSHRKSRVQEKAQNYFMLLEVFDDFEATLIQLMNLPTWNPLAQIVVQFTKPFESVELQREWTRRLFKELLMQDCLKVNVMYQFANDTNRIRVVTWFPYHNVTCADQVDNVRRIEECVVTEQTNTTTGKIERIVNITSYNQEMYPLVPRKLHKCTLRVASIVWEPFVVASEEDDDDDDDNNVDKGLEVLMLKTIAQGMNLQLNFKAVNKERATKIITDNNKTGLYAKLLQK
jgi:hypothetical protein